MNPYEQTTAAGPPKPKASRVALSLVRALRGADLDQRVKIGFVVFTYEELLVLALAQQDALPDVDAAISLVTNLQARLSYARQKLTQ